jgi:hypothetical protein
MLLFLASGSSKRRVVVFTASILALAGVATVASAATPDELRDERKAVQEEAAALAVEIEVELAEVEELEAALAAAQANVDGQQAAVDAAMRSVADAEAAAEEADRAIAALEARQVRTRIELRDAAIDSYVSFQSVNHLDVLGDDPWKSSRAETLADIGAGNSFDVLDELRTIVAELELQREVAQQARTDAAAYRDAMEDRLKELAAARGLEETLLLAALARQERRLGEAAALSQLEASLADEIRVEEQRIADAIASRLPPRSGSVTIPDGVDIELVTVNGIVVNAQIEDNVRGLLAAMSARGFDLSGGGYRSVDSQIRLRRANCGTSDYAIWEMPASQCRPPTARPGLSQHELGLAIDFTIDGRVIRCRDCGVFRALSEVAPEFGFLNLPSEPWHWSTTGG